MGWFNSFGMGVLFVMMIPNMIDAHKHPEDFENKFESKTIEYFEQIGRVGSFALMVFNIPFLCGGIWAPNGLEIYHIVDAVLMTVYICGWISLQRDKPVLRAYVLSVTPSLIFLFSGVMLLSYPLILFSVVFAASHITISVKNAKLM